MYAMSTDPRTITKVQGFEFCFENTRFYTCIPVTMRSARVGKWRGGTEYYSLGTLNGFYPDRVDRVLCHLEIMAIIDMVNSVQSNMECCHFVYCPHIDASV
jgi:hypothetical protein